MRNNKDEKITISIISGFLGSGKTTLLKHYISETIRPELSTASEKVATASSLSKEEVKELNRLLGKVIDAFTETKE